MIINTFICIRNNEQDIYSTLKCFEDCESNGVEFIYHVFENDSSDNTISIMKEFLSTRNGKIRSIVLNTTEWSHIVSSTRVANMALYRNECKKMCTTWDECEFSMVVDTNIQFTFEDVSILINSIKNDSSITASFPFSVVENVGSYYDTYALRSASNKKYIPFSSGSYIYVKSAFGGLCIVPNKVYQQCYYGVPDDDSDNEHVFISEQLRTHGHLVICKSVRCKWKKD